MAKVKHVFVCQNCGANYSKWQGKCNNCGQWNTVVEETVVPETKNKAFSSGNRKAPVPRKLDEIEFSDEKHWPTADQELNRVLGGGLIRGGVILLAGEPGIGKSTILLQLALSAAQKKVLYISGEESVQQIQMRSQRLGSQSELLWLYAETDTSAITAQIDSLQPDMVIVDSIQTVYSPHVESAAGSVSQVRQASNELIQLAKQEGFTLFLVGHITKEGSIAGPKVLEHMVDTVLQFEGDRHLAYRILRTIKNRYGSTQELGIYEMTSVGLRQVENPSEILITQREGETSGVAISASIEGNRTLLVELQALVSPATYGNPQRSATGYDQRRLNMLLAVLEKKCGHRFGVEDVFLNVAGGIRIEDPALDLAICAALVSSLEDTPLSDKICFIGEVGLTGEIRAVNRVEGRIEEAMRLGFNRVVISSFNKISKKQGIKVDAYPTLSDMFRKL